MEMENTVHQFSPQSLLAGTTQDSAERLNTSPPKAFETQISEGLPDGFDLDPLPTELHFPQQSQSAGENVPQQIAVAAQTSESFCAPNTTPTTEIVQVPTSDAALLSSHSATLPSTAGTEHASAQMTYSAHNTFATATTTTLPDSVPTITSTTTSIASTYAPPATTIPTSIQTTVISTVTPTTTMPMTTAVPTPTSNPPTTPRSVTTTTIGMDQSLTASQFSHGPVVEYRFQHNLIERKRRLRITNGIEEIEEMLPKKYRALIGAQPSKSEILFAAIRYVEDVQKKLRDLSLFNLLPPHTATTPTTTTLPSSLNVPHTPATYDVQAGTPVSLTTTLATRLQLQAALMRKTQAEAKRSAAGQDSQWIPDPVAAEILAAAAAAGTIPADAVQPMGVNEPQAQDDTAADDDGDAGSGGDANSAAVPRQRRPGRKRKSVVVWPSVQRAETRRKTNTANKAPQSNSPPPEHTVKEKILKRRQNKANGKATAATSRPKLAEDVGSETTQNKRRSRSQKLFKCEACGKAFYAESTLERHVKSECNSTMPYVCLVSGCNQGFNTAAKLHKHRTTQHQDQPKS